MVHALRQATWGLRELERQWIPAQAGIGRHTVEYDADATDISETAFQLTSRGTHN